MSGAYRDSGQDYLDAGWNPLPMKPTNNKSTPPKGFTGWRGIEVRQRDVDQWFHGFPDYDVAIRMPAGVIGIDVDHYGAKVGGDEIAKLEAELGQLPPTWASSARAVEGAPMPSAIWFYAVPVGFTFPTRPCADVEFIQRHHRYAVVAPSTHKTGKQYRWYEPNGSESDDCPEVDDLTTLPWAWLERFVIRDACGNAAETALPEKVAEFFKEHAKTLKPAALLGITNALAAAKGSRHDTLVEVACWAMREAAAGYYSAEAALSALEQWWLKVMDDPARLRADADDSSELTDAIAWAIAQAEADPERIAKLRSQLTGELPLGLPDEFWNARPRLAHIRQAAHSRARSGDAFLGAVLARLAGLTHPSIQLPPTVGAPAPLSVFVAEVGKSGLGKTATIRGASDLLPYIGNAVADGSPLGSGEGLVELYFDNVTVDLGHGKTKEEKVQTRHGAVIYLDEGQALAELGSRKGATLLPTLRTAWSGGTLGSSNADKSTKRKLSPGTYAMGLVIGFQPTKAAELLDDTVGGTPQRFLWLSALDASVPDEVPEWPGPLGWAHPKTLIIGGIHQPHMMGLPPELAAWIRRQGVLVTRGEIDVDDLDSHAILGKLKVAGLLAVLEGRADINDEDWELAAMVVRVSDRVRAEVLFAVDIQKRKTAEAHVAHYVRRESAVASSSLAETVMRMAAVIARHVHRQRCAGGCTNRCASRAIASRDRQAASAEEAIDKAIAQEWISLDGEHLSPGSKAPS